MFTARRVRVIFLTCAVLVLATVYAWTLLARPAAPVLTPQEHSDAPPIPAPHSAPEPLA